ncbi:MAG: hypothetical protein IPP71_01615 [Bacteroidetes bacterium]|nr:hypothetical protein [Bacteroidota bacterium]
MKNETKSLKNIIKSEFSKKDPVTKPIDNKQKKEELQIDYEEEVPQ